MDALRRALHVGHKRRPLLFAHVGGALEAEGVHRDVARIQRDDLIERVREGLEVVARQTDDEVGVDVLDAGRRRDLVGAVEVRRRVAPADIPEHLVREGLRVDADPRHAIAPRNFEFFRRDRIGSARLEREFLERRDVGALRNCGEQRFQPLRVQRGGRAAADVDRGNRLAEVADERKGALHVLNEQRKIIIEDLQHPVGRGDERAVGAARGAERDRNIHRAEVVSLAARELQLGLRDRGGEIGFLGV